MNYQHLLGTMTDADIARLAGVSRQSVSEKRKKLGIPKYQDVEAIACPKCHSARARHNMVNPSGSIQYYCLSCKSVFTPNPNPRGTKPLCDRSMTGYERLKRWKKKKENNA